MTPGSPKNQDYFRKGARKSQKSGQISHSAGSVAAAAHAAQEGEVMPGLANISVPSLSLCNNQHIIGWDHVNIYWSYTDTDIINYITQFILITSTTLPNPLSTVAFL